MNAASLSSSERCLLAGGLVASIAVLLLAILDAADVFTGWLAAAVFLQALPVGAIMLLLAMRLIPGEWRRELGPSCRHALVLVPLAALAMLVPLVASGTIYPWTASVPDSAFARAWMSPVPFALRTLAWFAFVWFLARSIARERYGGGFAAASLIAIVLATHVIASDWLMSLYPGYASSAVGLQLLSLEAYIAPAVMVLLGFAGGAPHRPSVMGGVLLTFLLLWLFLQFMPFLVAWSGNLPDSVEWYAVRDTPGWHVVIALIAVLGCGPLLALFFTQVRCNPRWLRLCAASALAGKALEFAWLALPGRGLLGAVSAFAAAIGLGSIALSMLLRERRLREREA